MKAIVLEQRKDRYFGRTDYRTIPLLRRTLGARSLQDNSRHVGVSQETRGVCNEQEHASYIRFGEGLFSEGTKVTTSKNLHKVTLTFDNIPAWAFVSTQSAPMHFALEEGESIQQRVDRSTQKSAD